MLQTTATEARDSGSQGCRVVDLTATNLSVVIPMCHFAFEFREHRVGSVAKDSVRGTKLRSLLNVEAGCDRGRSHRILVVIN